jgi:ribose 5-phosphate isomerase B
VTDKSACHPDPVSAVAQDPSCAGLARSHSNTNVSIGGKIIGSALALDVVRSWLDTDYLGADSSDESAAMYARRVGEVVQISERHLKPL